MVFECTGVFTKKEDLQKHIETGAAQATGKALPDIQGKFDGVAIRCPVPVGSISDIVFITSKDTSVKELNKIFKEEATPTGTKVN